MRGRKTGGRDFKPGNPGGPGRPKAPTDLREAMKVVLSMQSEFRFDWQHYYKELANLTMAELTALVGGKHEDPITKKVTVIPSSEPEAPVLKLMVARAILHAMRTGKASELQAHRENMCGPQPKPLELSGPGGEPLSPLVNFSVDQLTAAFSVLDRLIKGEAECKSIQNSQQSSESSVPLSPQPGGMG